MNFNRIIFTAIFVLCCEHHLIAQQVETRTFYQDNFGPRCEGDIIELGFDNEISCYKRKVGVCSSPFPDEFEDKSEQIQITGPGTQTPYLHRTLELGTNHATIKVMMVRARLAETGEIRVTSRCTTQHVIGPICGGYPPPPETYILERIWIFKIIVVPKPPMPSLNLDRYISPKIEGVKFIANGCPTDNKEYHYFYQWNNTQCLSDTNNFFYADENDDNIQLGNSGRYYRVKCATLSGTCTSEPSKFEFGLTYTPPDSSLVPKEEKQIINFIESIKKSDRKDYHNYDVKTDICQQTSNNQQVCNVQTVFNLMLEDKAFIAPIASDIRYNSYDSNELFGIDNSSVKSYEVVNLAGTGVNLVLGKDWGLFRPYIKNLVTESVMTYIDQPNHLIINYTLSNHILRPGRIIRAVVQECDKIKVITIGEGLSHFGDNWAGEIASQINASDGKIIFRNVDFRLLKAYDLRYR